MTCVLNVLILADFGLPPVLTGEQLARSLAGAAKATLDSRHPCPRIDPTDNLAVTAGMAGPGMFRGPGFEMTPQHYSNLTPGAEGGHVGYYTHDYNANTNRHDKGSSEGPKTVIGGERLYRRVCRRWDWVSEEVPGSALAGIGADFDFHTRDVHGS